MTRSSALAALRRALLPALVAAAAALALVMALLLSRAPEYQARVGVVAVPVATADGSDAEYGAVVSSVMPALPEVAVSSPVLARLADRFPDVDAARLAQSVSVELVPASGVARVTATGDSPESAQAVLRAVVAEIVDSGLLASVGSFSVLGDVDAEPVRVGPDPLLAGGLGLLAAVVAGLLAVAAVHILRPRLLTVDDVERHVRSVLAQDVPVVDVGRGDRGLDLVAARVALASPGSRRVQPFPAGAWFEGDVIRALDERLAERPADGAAATRVADDPGAHQPAGRTGYTGSDARHRVRDAGKHEGAVVTLHLRRTAPDDLTAALLAAVAAGYEVAVVMAR